MDYTGIKCPVCNVPFKKGDDIVVCAYCGAPYHRVCYDQEGDCIFQDEHGSGKAWEPPAPPKTATESAEIKDVECASCGLLNTHSSSYCNRCGAKLSDETPKKEQTPFRGPAFTPFPSQPSGSQNSAFPQFMFDPMGGVPPTDMLDDNVSFGDVSKLVRVNTQYYLPRFKHIKESGRNKFNFSAFLFSGAWMLYRKQYKFGAIITVLIFALYIANTILTLNVSAPLLNDLLTRIGASSQDVSSLSSGEMLAITEILIDQPLMQLKLCLPLICLILMLSIMIFVGVRGNRMYMRHCVKTIQETKSSESASDFSVAIESKSGVNIYITICLFVCYTIITYLPSFLII